MEEPTTTTILTMSGSPEPVIEDCALCWKEILPQNAFQKDLLKQNQIHYEISLLRLFSIEPAEIEKNGPAGATFCEECSLKIQHLVELFGQLDFLQENLKAVRTSMETEFKNHFQPEIIKSSDDHLQGTGNNYLRNKIAGSLNVIQPAPEASSPVDFFDTFEDPEPEFDFTTSTNITANPDAKPEAKPLSSKRNPKLIPKEKQPRPVLSPTKIKLPINTKGIKIPGIELKDLRIQVEELPKELFENLPINVSEGSLNRRIKEIRQEAVANSEKHKEGQFKCDYPGCKNVTGYANAHRLKFHQNKYHPGMGLQFKCEPCGLSFQLRFHLKKHFRTHHLGELHTCNICGKDYFSKYNLIRHVNLHETRGNLIRKWRSKYGDGKLTDLENHERTKEKELQAFTEELQALRKRKSKSRKNISKHVGEAIEKEGEDAINREGTEAIGKEGEKAIENEGEKAIENEGEKAVENEGEIPIEKNSEEPEESAEKSSKMRKNLFTCNDCGKNFKRNCQLKFHVQSHLKEEKLQLDESEAEEDRETSTGGSKNKSKPLKKSKRNLGKTHKNTNPRKIGQEIHEDRQDQQKNIFYCYYPDCPLKMPYATAEQLEIHTKTMHEGVTHPFVCELCGKKFRTRHPLKLHVECQHFGKFPYNCSFCGKGFVSKRFLENHTPVHTNERKFQCKECPKTFKTEKGRLSHVLYLHTSASDRPARCDRCGKGFTTTTKLRNHIRSVHESHIRPHICHFCGKGFPISDYLYMHMRQHKKEGYPMDTHNWAERKPKNKKEQPQNETNNKTDDGIICSSNDQPGPSIPDIPVPNYQPNMLLEFVEGDFRSSGSAMQMQNL